MSAVLSIDARSAVPPYAQIRAGIVAQVAAGTLLPGDRLPAIRALAEELGVAAGTAARAYRELEEAGIITTRRGAGTRIAVDLDPSSLPTAAGFDPAVARFAAEAVADARARGLPLDQLVAAVRAEIAAHSEG